MSGMRAMAKVIVGIALMGLIAVPARAQQIRDAQPPPGAPNVESVYLLCDGVLPGCSGKYYQELAANVVLGSAIFKELQKMNQSLDAIKTSSAELPTIKTATEATKNTLATQVAKFDSELRTTIADMFNTLPADLLASDAMKQFKKDLLDEVDKRIKAAAPSNP